MKPHIGIAIAIGIMLTVLAGGVVIFLAMAEKASFVEIDRQRSWSADVGLHITSLDEDRPFELRASAGGGRDTFQQNPYDANNLRIACTDRGQTTVQEYRLPPGRSRVVTISAPSGCADVRVTSRRFAGAP